MVSSDPKTKLNLTLLGKVLITYKEPCLARLLTLNVVLEQTRREVSVILITASNCFFPCQTNQLLGVNDLQRKLTNS